MSEIRICEDCGGEYSHESIEFGGVDLMARISFCDPCSEKRAGIERDEERLEKARARYHRVVEEEYRDTNINHPNYPMNAHTLGQKWISKTVARELPWFGIIGGVGLGKTRVISQMVKKMIWDGSSAEWATATTYSMHCDNQRKFCDVGKNATYWIDRYRKTPVLVFDDLGKQEWTSTVCASFFDLVEYRYSRKLPLLWSSNDSLEEMEKQIKHRQREAIIDRLRGNSLFIEL